MLSRRLPALLLPLALGLPAAGATPAATPRRLLREPGRAFPAVIADGFGLEVAQGDRSTHLSLPPGSRLESVSGLGDGWLVAATRPEGDQRELLLVADLGRGASELPPPADRTARRTRPVPVVAPGGLEGLLWLEGASDEVNGVRWASWNGTGFEAPQIVAAPGAGSQLALAAARLDDGRILAVWAGYDGDDDEIWASVRADGSWSAPTRVAPDDRVPDIVPAVTAAPGGAWIAWSHFDGSEYRIATSRFDGRRFVASDPRGPAGSLYPSFERLGDETLLLWFDAASDRWTLAGIGPEGRLSERASVPGTSSDRPAVERPAEGGFRFRFADGRAESDRR